MHPLTLLIKGDMKPALGVTEPGAIAFAAAKAKSYTKGAFVRLKMTLNSGMYKNAFTCGIPNSSEVGNVFAAALGVVAGNHEKGLLALEDVTPDDNARAQRLIDEGKIEVNLGEITSDIFISATVTTDQNICELTITGSHTNIAEIKLDGENVFSKPAKKEAQDEETPANIHEYTLKQIYEYITTVPIEEISFIRDAYDLNLELFQEGLNNPRTTITPVLLKQNGGAVYSGDEVKTAQLLCNGAIEARVIGLDKAAMSITGSGAHGIICTLPLYAVYKTNNLAEEALLRATALSYLICMYIKEYSGRLSAFCGCAIAGGTGAACAVGYMKGAGLEQLARIIGNMASGITGMICDGGNQGCVMKGIVAVDAMFRAAALALDEAYIFDRHGINGATPEATMRYMGMIASPGMTGTEKTIMDILQDKANRA